MSGPQQQSVGAERLLGRVFLLLAVIIPSLILAALVVTLLLKPTLAQCSRLGQLR